MISKELASYCLFFNFLSLVYVSITLYLFNNFLFSFFFIMSDFYVVIHIATTCDESTAYVPRDATEVIALSWTTVNSRTLETSELHNVLVRPVNTPITPHCQQVHGISWDQVRVAGTFQDAISQIDADISSSLAGSDFSVVTFDASEIRVQLQREARDKNVTLPDWLRLPRVFELPVEFSNWSAKDDSKDAKDASLATIAAAMGVENNEQRKITEKENEGDRANKEKDENDKVDNEKVDVKVGEKVDEKEESKTKNDSQSPADDGLIRGLGENTCVVYANILVALAKAALPVEEHPQVLTHPHDSAQDHAAFEAERSKVVYLSNLLPDTTQPELELWFAQSGGRPAAFWMLSNADPAARRGHAGFAIFASHEDAADALAMNGRVLNDRAVEVQPSSARVLDRATELLVSFPLLRNRPRPGDWTCPSCGFSNFQRRTHCFRCLFPASSAVAIQESMYLGRKPGFAGLSGYGYGDNGYQSGGNGYYYNGGGGQRFGNSVPFRAGDWKCELCMYHNFAKNLACLKCSAAKPAATASGMLSVNLTAAAIAAATASGQPLNLGGGLMGLQQPQPMHAQFSRNNLTSSSNSSASNTPRDKVYYGRNGTATPQGSLKGWLGYYKDDKGISSAMGLMSLDDGRRS